MGSLRRLLDPIVARPGVYEFTQTLAGSRNTEKRIAALLGDVNDPHAVLDLGGGTGIYRGCLPSGVMYVCMDLDHLKLRGFLRKHQRGTGLLADGVSTPLRSQSMDVILCVSVSHHIPDPLLDSFLSEAQRILKDGGMMVFQDAVWWPRQLTGRLLWSLDRGCYPRRMEALIDALSRHFTVVRLERYSFLHKYVLCLLSKRL